MSLSTLLAEKRAKSASVIPAEKLAVMQKCTNSLKEESLGAKAVKKGDKLPDFKLPNSEGKIVSLSDFTSENLVVSFYRGGWCPYCNMELKALQEALPKFKSLNTDLVAISPETPDNSLSTSQKNEIEFNILSDIDNEYAKSLGLAFKMPEDLKTIYKEFNINVDKHNGNENYELPMPATYVINKNREIILSFIPEDYTERLDPETILEVLKK